MDQLSRAFWRTFEGGSTFSGALLREGPLSGALLGEGPLSGALSVAFFLRTTKKLKNERPKNATQKCDF